MVDLEVFLAEFVFGQFLLDEIKLIWLFVALVMMDLPYFWLKHLRYDLWNFQELILEQILSLVLLRDLV